MPQTTHVQPDRFLERRAAGSTGLFARRERHSAPMALTITNGSAPVATASGSGASGDAWGQVLRTSVGRMLSSGGLGSLDVSTR